MSVTSGFFNSISGDRRYNSEQISALFDGLINDGVFANIGTAFGVNASDDNEIAVGIGRAWLNSSWIYNDSILPLTLSASDVLRDRYDAVVIEIDTSENVRAGSIKIVEGVAASNPAKPVMINTNLQHQHPICYIYRKAGSTKITQADITNMVGTSSLPYVTGILEVQSIDKIVAQWEAQWTQWRNTETAEFDEWRDTETAEFEQWLATEQAAFTAWFASMRGLLDEETATKLANRLMALEDGTTPAGKAIADASGNNIKETYSTKGHTHSKSQISDFPSSMPPTAHTHSKSQINDFPSSMPPTAHNQAASTITAGTLAGKVVANASAVSTTTDKQVRNIYAGTTDMTAGTTTLATGDIYVMYE